jgi:hypothetical protein
MCIALLIDGNFRMGGLPTFLLRQLGGSRWGAPGLRIASLSGVNFGSGIGSYIARPSGGNFLSGELGHGTASWCYTGESAALK